jgi:hypothetical protein
MPDDIPLLIFDLDGERLTFDGATFAGGRHAERLTRLLYAGHLTNPDAPIIVRQHHEVADALAERYGERFTLIRERFLPPAPDGLIV